MIFEDEPAPGDPLPLRPGHSSNGRLERVLRSGAFAVTAELAPPESADPEEVYSRARVFDGVADAINGGEASDGSCHMSSIAMCALLARRGYSSVVQFSCRDRNRVALAGDVLGAAALGVANVLCLTGDGVPAARNPQAKPVYDLDGIDLLKAVRALRDEANGLEGQVLAIPPRVFLGGALNPFTPPLDYRVERLARKVEAGAQFIQTQFCFDVAAMRAFMERVRAVGLHREVFILVGVGPLSSPREADWLGGQLPGVHIPDAVRERLAGSDKPRLEGRRICLEIIQGLREIEGVAGVHLMAHHQEEAVAEVIDASGVLEGRTPWHPGRPLPVLAEGARA